MDPIKPREQVDSLKSLLTLMHAQDEQMYKYVLSDIDIFVDISKSVFLGAVGGYIATVAISPSIFNDVYSLKSLLLKVIF